MIGILFLISKSDFYVTCEFHFEDCDILFDIQKIIDKKERPKKRLLIQYFDTILWAKS